MNTIEIHTPKPTKIQQVIMSDPARFRVVSAGRQVGKTMLGALESFDRQLDNGERILIASLTQRQADYFWQYITRWATPLVNRRLLKRNESRRILDGGDRLGTVMVKTAHKPDNLAGDKADFIVVDECALLDPHAWWQILYPMLLTTNGRALFLSTPRRRNWFYHMYLRGQSGDVDWSSYQFSSYENPFIARETIEEYRLNMPEDLFEQEIMARFLPGQGQVFRHFTERVQDIRHKPNNADPCVLGVDWARYQDYTVLTVINAHTGQVVDIERFNRVSWEFQTARIRALCDYWPIQLIVAERNSMGDVAIENLRMSLAGRYSNAGMTPAQRRRLPQGRQIHVEAFYTTNQSKTQIVHELQFAFEKDLVKIPNNPDLLAELEAYEQSLLPSGLMRYEAAQGLHDDMVMSLMLAWHGVLLFDSMIARQSNTVVRYPKAIGNY